jgi:hypothetical protein
MAKRLPGRTWFKFTMFGLPWEARIAKQKSAVLDKGNTLACVFYNERVMYFSDHLTLEQQRTAFVHELQHMIEEHADVDYGQAASHEISERCTDQVARGWLYFIRHCPEIIDFLRAE